MADRTYRFHPEAATDLDASIAWYESRRAGLGREFLDAVAARIEDVTAQPRRWRVVHGARRAPLRRFPFAIVFREATDGVIEVVAVAHTSRRPGFWRVR